jgi:hypothetical protein
MVRALFRAFASLALAGALPAAADGDDGVVVIRGASVSVAKPLTVERARDGSAEVEIVRVEMAAPPAAAPRPRAPEREIVVVVVPAAEPVPPEGIPLAWAPPWGWGEPRGHRQHRGHFGAHRHRYFLPGLHLDRAHAGPRFHAAPRLHGFGAPRGQVRAVLHGR